MNEQMHCGGCGILLQSEDKDKLGYVPQSTLENTSDILCKRCFQMRHYNKNVAVDMDDDDFLQMIASIRNEKGLIVHLIDLFDVNGTLLSSLPRLIGNNPVILVGNKVDLLPKSTNHNKLRNWLFHLAKEKGIRVIDVFLISAKNGQKFSDVTAALELERKDADIYVVGVTNVGKSTFINQVIRQSTGIEEAITTSYYPGTTLGFIEVPIGEDHALIDTPGIINKGQMAHYLSDQDLKVVTATKEVKARNYQLNDKQTLFIGGLARFDFIKGERQPFICYFANKIDIHRTKLENADTLYEKHVGQMLSPPSIETLQTLPAMTATSFKINEAYTDIVFPGLGWITVVEGNITVTVHSPKGISPSIRRSFL